MAIYHLEAKVISRGAGRSACAASAYISCSAIYNEYDGVQHDYTRKQGLVWEHVFLPDCAPAEWQDRAKLWNAVEEAEKTKDSRLAREFVVALPIELGKDEWVDLLSKFIQEQFVDEGMCADTAIHDTDGHNPHAHIMLTVRPLNENGTWQHKTEKEYLCVKDREERGFTATEYKEAQKNGWEKQYLYKVGKKKEYLTPSTAEAQGLERVSKYPKSTKYGRQNPISERWNSEEQLVKWRAAWADEMNLFLEQKGLDERIDHRSFADQGKDEQPTIHEGVAARAMEKKGIVSDRCELNRQIKRDNALLREIKAMVENLTLAVQSTITTIAHALEHIRQNILVMNYKQHRNRELRNDLTGYIEKTAMNYNAYIKLRKDLKAKHTKKEKLEKEFAVAPLFAVRERREMKATIAELTEEISDLQSRGTIMLRKLSKENTVGIEGVKEAVKQAQISAAELDEKTADLTSLIKNEREKYTALREQAVTLDHNSLAAARLAIRSQMEREALEEIRKEFPKRNLIRRDLERSIKDTDNLLGDDVQSDSRKTSELKQRRSHAVQQER